MPKYNGGITLASSVSNLEESLAWFKEILGFEEVFKAAEVGWAEVTTPTEGVTIGLGQNEEVDGAGGTTPVFGVEDIDAARSELASIVKTKPLTVGAYGESVRTLARRLSRRQ